MNSIKPSRVMKMKLISTWNARHSSSSQQSQANNCKVSFYRDSWRPMHELRLTGAATSASARRVLIKSSN